MSDDIQKQIILDMKRRHEENAKPKAEEKTKRVRKSSKPAVSSVSETDTPETPEG